MGKILAILGVFVLLKSLIYLDIILVFFGLFLMLPICIGLLDLKFREYKVNEEDVVITEGVFSRKCTKIPYHKINKIMINQGPIGILANSGNIEIQTGNDSYSILKDLDSPKKILEKINKKNKDN